MGKLPPAYLDFEYRIVSSTLSPFAVQTLHIMHPSLYCTSTPARAGVLHVHSEGVSVAKKPGLMDQTGG